MCFSVSCYFLSNNVLETKYVIVALFSSMKTIFNLLLFFFDFYSYNISQYPNVESTYCACYRWTSVVFIQLLRLYLSSGICWSQIFFSLQYLCQNSTPAFTKRWPEPPPEATLYTLKLLIWILTNTHIQSSWLFYILVASRSFVNLFDLTTVLCCHWIAHFNFAGVTNFLNIFIDGHKE